MIIFALCNSDNFQTVVCQLFIVFSVTVTVFEANLRLRVDVSVPSNDAHY
jgi:hypothetical protein